MLKNSLFFSISCICISISAQDLTQIGKAKLVTVSGGVATNTVFYEGSALRDPLTYVLNGNINFNISGLFNIPLSFAYSNQEFNYSQPFKFNRLSIHPSYKWVTAHIGDVAMTFSPYTLSGHQFSGVGVDLTPEGKFKISAMYGRLIRPIEFNIEEPDAVPAYKRLGYGIKTNYDFDSKTKVGLTIFNAKDVVNSLNSEIPIDVGVSPKENLVVSFEGAIKPIDDLEFNVEYAISAVTEDLNSPKLNRGKGPLSFVFDEKLSTSYYNAFNANIKYVIGNGAVGVGYERIDPDYKTFGAYFFNNDFENITVNVSQSLLNNKLSLSVNAGLQSDNLDNTKKSDLKRIVTAVNASLTASDKLTISGSYSNFQSYTNIRSQFDYINAITEYDNIDDLNFKQLSQNANMSIGYVLSKKETKSQNINFNVSFQDTKDIQEAFLSGIESTVNNSQFYNSALAYTLSFPESTLSISTAFNATLNKLQEANAIALGPTLILGKQFFDKTVKTSLSSSYNTSSSDGVKQNSVLNFRLNTGYQLYEKHQFNLSALTLLRNTPTANNSDFTVTLGYNYSFSSSGKKASKKREQVPGGHTAAVNTEKSFMKIRYRKDIYEGDAITILSQIDKLRHKKNVKDMPNFKKAEINKIKEEVLLLQSEDVAITKDKVIDYLEAIYNYIDFKENYNNLLFKASLALKKQAMQLDLDIENSFVDKKFEIENHKFKGQSPEAIQNKTDVAFNSYTEVYTNFITARQRLIGHRWMLEQLDKIKISKQFDREILFADFKTSQLSETYKLYSNTTNESIIVDFLINEMILYYHDIVKDKLDSPSFILKYIKKSE
ncbi:hypothetical protein [Olleya sp. Bg11-27]|uniref:hypothetical protein n=1 Tax=Olleya sp. Bg11-27 TaxID=2058135 RepID=UPI000C302171|nr:hypothetical protein [Olleya sp. Bg11-27]AUC76142.1 hypothetical protein CW732_10890 [Olleya sp. Bg11-27]